MVWYLKFHLNIIKDILSRQISFLTRVLFGNKFILNFCETNHTYKNIFKQKTAYKYMLDVLVGNYHYAEICELIEFFCEKNLLNLLIEDYSSLLDDWLLTT